VKTTGFASKGKRHPLTVGKDKVAIRILLLSENLQQKEMRTVLYASGAGAGVERLGGNLSNSDLSFGWGELTIGRAGREAVIFGGKRGLLWNWLGKTCRLEGEDVREAEDEMRDIPHSEA